MAEPAPAETTGTGAGSPTTMPSEAMPADAGLAARILVVVPTLNEAAGIEACLASLMTPGTEGVAFVVSDGGSTDGTRNIVARLADARANLSLAQNPRRVQAAAVNAAARGTDRALLVRCDAHATYPEGYVLGVARAMQRTGAASLVVSMDTAARAGAGLFERANALAVGTPLGTGGSAHRGGRRSGWTDHGHHAGLDRAALLAVGGYDETLPANEDAELDTRLARAGRGVWLEASLRPTYHPRSTARALLRQYARYGEGRALHARRHAVPLRLRQRAPALLGPVLLGSLIAGAFVPPLLLVPSAYACALLAASVALAVQRRDPAGLLAWAPLGIMHLAWSFGYWRGVLRRGVPRR